MYIEEFKPLTRNETQKMRAKRIILDGSSLQIIEAKNIANGSPIEINPNVRNKIESSRRLVEKISKSNTATYGVNTGFGFLANKKISLKDQNRLQANLLRSHSSGYGASLPIPMTRLAMALRLNVLLKGYSGVRFQLCETLCALINSEIYPVIPEYGSVGASGDLAPLAHLALPLIGEGNVYYKNKLMPSKDALTQAGIKPYKLGPKEGLALINGTQIMLAIGLLPFLEGKDLLDLADRITALTFNALAADPAALLPEIHQIRGQSGQMISAQNILGQLNGSFLFDNKTKRHRVQDPYSLRCAPQVHGPTRDAFSFVEKILQTELNAATDNPLVFTEDEKIISGGNFHGQYLAMAFDMASISLAEIGSVSERRLELLLNPHLSGLPPFLAMNDGVNSGYMAAQYLSASLVNENKLLANPSCTDSIPGNVGIEDHVSMGMTSARKFRKIVENVRVILGIEILAAAQGVDLRGEKKLGNGSKRLFQTIREKIPMLKKDRIISDDIITSVEILKTMKELE